jgi:hypothetical protein
MRRANAPIRPRRVSSRSARCLRRSVLVKHASEIQAFYGVRLLGQESKRLRKAANSLHIVGYWGGGYPTAYPASSRSTSDLRKRVLLWVNSARLDSSRRRQHACLEHSFRQGAAAGRTRSALNASPFAIRDDLSKLHTRFTRCEA